MFFRPGGRLPAGLFLWHERKIELLGPTFVGNEALEALGRHADPVGPDRTYGVFGATPYGVAVTDRTAEAKPTDDPDDPDIEALGNVFKAKRIKRTLAVHAVRHETALPTHTGGETVLAHGIERGKHPWACILLSHEHLAPGGTLHRSGRPSIDRACPHGNRLFPKIRNRPECVRSLYGIRPRSRAPFQSGRPGPHLACRDGYRRHYIFH